MNCVWVFVSKTSNKSFNDTEDKDGKKNPSVFHNLFKNIQTCFEESISLVVY